MFDQLDDGSHEISLRNIRVPDCEQYEKTHGTLRWTREAGISFELHFDGIYGLSKSAFFASRAPEVRGVGKFGESDLVTPQWVAETDAGTVVKLFGVNQTPSTFQQNGSDGSSTASLFTGTAQYAIVEIPTKRLLAFPESSREDFRMFFSGVAGRCFSAQEETRFEDHNGSILSSVRCEIELRDQPRVCMVASYGQVKCKPSGWLSFEQAPTNADCEIAAVPEQTFVSFLNGEKVAFHWADRNIGNGLIRRSYYGWSISPQNERMAADYRPLPFLNPAELHFYGNDILLRLPKLFDRFCETDKDMRYGNALHPLWTALHSVLQDRVALASLSLERISSYWRSYKKSAKGKQHTKAPQSIWDQSGSLKKVRRVLCDCLKKWLVIPAKANSFGERVKSSLFEKVLEFSGDPSVQFRSQDEKKEFIEVLRKKIENITQTPNAASLKNPYLDVGLSVSADEQKALHARNPALHGHVRSNETLEQLNEDAQTFDHLRMLITKFVLKFCDYDGPYIDYASRPVQGDFAVRCLAGTGTDTGL